MMARRYRGHVKQRLTTDQAATGYTGDIFIANGVSIRGEIEPPEGEDEPSRRRLSLPSQETP